MKPFQKINTVHLNRFREISGVESVITDIETLDNYGHDETEDLNYRPETVIKPAGTHQISGILKYCNEQNIPVTPRAGGTGLSGGALPVFGGVSLSIEKLNRILEIDERNLQVTVQPGVITQVLQEAVIEKNLYYPPDPSSRGTCFIGGNIAENSGGPRAVKYGVVKDYVLNLEVVLPNGEIIMTGANVLKNSTGYNLTQLMVGSEGTLGIVTKIILKLIPYPPYNLTLLAPFKSLMKASEAVSAIFRAGIIPSALEIMERDALEITMDFVKENVIQLEDETEGHLLIEVDGYNEADLYTQSEKIYQVLEQFDVGDILVADSEKQKEDLWSLRRKVGEAVKGNSIYKEEDTVVPRAELPILLKGVKEIGKKYGFRSICYGHAGDGNLHVNILKDGMSDDEWNRSLKNGIREIFQLTRSLGGTLSGEHGIGWVQKDYMDIVFSKEELRLMKKIKEIFDPNGILNPGKIFA